MVIKDNNWMYERHFSMDGATLQRINEKLSITNDAAIEGNLLKRFRGLKVVFLNTVFKFTGKKDSDDKVKKIRKLIVDIRENFEKMPLPSHNKNSIEKFFIIRNGNIERKLDKLEENINQMLYDHDIIHLKVLKREFKPNEKW